MSGPNKKMTDQMRAMIVQRLACYETPKEVVAALKEQFGIEMTRQNVENYDPTKRGSKKWRKLFEATRKAFLEHVENSVPAANKAVRVAKLSRAADALEGRGNLVGMKEMLEAVAKEMGNVHSNRRELTGKDGKPVEFSHMSESQLDQALVLVLTQAGIHAQGEADDGDSAVH